MALIPMHCPFIYIAHLYSIKYMIFIISACLIKGQVRKECASHPSCHQTCNNNETAICPEICIVDGCECPNGTVIDEDINECVTPSECTSMYVYIPLCTCMHGSKC